VVEGERHGVFIDYNQNAKDRTVAAAYSVRPTADARVSAPLSWDEVDSCEPGDFTLATMPARFARLGDRHDGIDEHAGSLESLLELSPATSATGSATRHGPRNTRKRPASRRACSRPAPARPSIR
jgi:DNA primase